MKTLIIYFSLEGNTKLIAEQMATTINADQISLESKKEYAKKGFKKYIWGGKSVVLGEEPELVNSNIDLTPYDTILIGTPVWAGSFAPPIKTFLKTYNLKGKKVALFACHAGGGAGRCFKNMKDQLKDCQILGEIDFVDPLKKADKNVEKAKNWVQTLAI